MRLAAGNDFHFAEQEASCASITEKARWKHGETTVLQGIENKGNHTADAREQRDRAREGRCIIPLHPRQDDNAG